MQDETGVCATKFSFSLDVILRNTWFLFCGQRLSNSLKKDLNSSDAYSKLLSDSSGPNRTGQAAKAMTASRALIGLWFSVNNDKKPCKTQYHSSKL